jgi:gluconate 2-dehydrogenase gamma chain
MTDRRSFLRGSSVLLGSAALGSVLEAFAATPRKATHFPASSGTLRAVVDVILPATDSPAASAADTHYFIDLAVPACASPEALATFKSGLAWLDNLGYARLPADQQVAELEARAQRDAALEYDDSFFKILKDYTLTGYFLSEVGATKALAYEQVPGGYWGDLPLAPDQKAWAI